MSLTPLSQELEQDRHDLRLKLQGCQALWESQVGELERDVRALNAHTERLTRQLSEAAREKSRREEQHNEISQQLQEQLQAVRSKFSHQYCYRDNIISFSHLAHISKPCGMPVGISIMTEHSSALFQHFKSRNADLPSDSASSSKYQPKEDMYHVF